MQNGFECGTRKHNSALRCVTFLLAIGVTTSAYCASPSLSSISPWGGQRGTEMEITLGGARIDDAKEIFFHGPGIEVLSVEPVNDKQAKAKIRIAADCPLGEHQVRLRTATGISELRSFHVGLFPAVAEAEPNTEFSQPNPISIGVTVTGTIENEDVDHFVLEAKKGDRITAEVEAIRLGITLFDAYVAILDEKRFELSATDDSALLLQDGFASIVAPEDGKYIIQIRESAYGGNGNCHYRLHVGNFPRPKALYPAGGKAGEEVAVKFLGDVAGDFETTIKLPDAPNPDFGLFAEQNGQMTTSPNPFRVSDLPNVLEVEPNNDVASATPAPSPLPVAFNGIIGEAEDFDYFKFSATKGQVFDINVYARRLRSPLDSVLHVFDAKGKTLAGNDDSGGPDSYLRFTIQEDGEYVVRVMDHLRKGGPDYVYRVEFEPVKASLALSIPQFARNSQDRQNIPVPKGNRNATIIQATRTNFGGDLVLSAEGLPAGVTMHADKMAANVNQMPVVFEATPEAEVAGKLTQLIGSHADPNQNIRGSFALPVNLVTGPPNITIYYTTIERELAVAVTEECPFKISVVEPKVPLVQNGSMQLKVVAERKEGFTAPITCYFPFNPPGVGSAGSATIGEGQTETYYQINANGKAAAAKWSVVVIAQANVGNGPIWVSSQLVPLEVAAPYMTLAIQMAATEQGKPTEVVCKVTPSTPFDGEAKVSLVGLPAQVTTKELTITKEATEVVFPVETAAGSPVGQHATLFCQVTVTQNGEPIVHNLGHGGVLRIDAPPPPKPDQPAAPAAAAATPPPAEPKPEVRLTRLQKLRLEQQERLKAAAAAATEPTTTAGN